ncbi:MAG TPA: SDR family NAD(P)-dependent oxidoreductase [Acetobacteraceae bacterium]|nr:SDR family NAD(P)-dependent oxidoreductase [Acetobacteraceae bacterium]
MPGPLDGSVALVTGASRGLGAAVAVELGRLGAHVVLTARTQGGLEETDDAIRSAGSSATLLPLDLKEGEPVDAIGPSLYQRFGRLDVLVHAAGVLGKLTPVSHIMPNDWAEAVAVNLDAAMRLIRTCEPLLRQAPAGRAVFVTDERAGAPLAYWATYGATKAAMEHLVRTWAQELQITRARANLFDPGPFRSRLRNHAFPGIDPATLALPEDVAPGLVPLCLPEEQRSGALVRGGNG